MIALDAAFDAFVEGVKETARYSDLTLVASVKDPALVRFDPVHAAVMLRERLQIDVAPVVVSRDQNRPQLLSSVLAGMQRGLTSVMLAWGDDLPASSGASNVRDFFVRRHLRRLEAGSQDGVPHECPGPGGPVEGRAPERSISGQREDKGGRRAAPRLASDDRPGRDVQLSRRPDRPGGPEREGAPGGSSRSKTGTTSGDTNGCSAGLTLPGCTTPLPPEGVDGRAGKAGRRPLEGRMLPRSLHRDPRRP